MEDILNPLYWKERYDARDKEIHRSIFHGSLPQFNEVVEQNRKDLSGIVGNNDFILDVGCGWGRVLEVLPKHWEGDYLGIDFSPELIDEARSRYPTRKFICHDLRKLDDLEFPNDYFDLAIAVWMESMFEMYELKPVWASIEIELYRIAKRVVKLA